ncbi:MAG: hypothetical protein KJN71_06975 [Acidimicrobiia bacterium]|nr:hypothetical protein [Acidimicrobiia bacterium]
MFAERRGIDEIVARYDYEYEDEVIEHGSGIPYDMAVTGDTLYYSQRETASFFGKPPVTWDMVTKVDFRNGRIASIQMFVDASPIERVYGAPGLMRHPPPQNQRQSPAPQDPARYVPDRAVGVGDIARDLVI